MLGVHFHGVLNAVCLFLVLSVSVSLFLCVPLKGACRTPDASEHGVLGLGFSGARLPNRVRVSGMGFRVA
jgi:hypothetical protein